MMMAQVIRPDGIPDGCPGLAAVGPTRVGAHGDVAAANRGMITR